MTFFWGWEGNDAGKYLEKALLPVLSGFLGGEDTSRYREPASVALSRLFIPYQRSFFLNSSLQSPSSFSLLSVLLQTSVPEAEVLRWGNIYEVPGSNRYLIDPYSDPGGTA